MKFKKSQIFTITLAYGNAMSRAVKIKARSRASAERRALRLNPSAKIMRPHA